MKKGIMIFLVLTLSAMTVCAQDYLWGIGIRAGGAATGVNAKLNLDPANALEGTLALVNGINFHGLYERHVPVIADGFRFYYGAGANIGAWKTEEDKEEFTLGIDGVIGLEYLVPTVPLALAVDYKPIVNLTGKAGFIGYDFGFAIRVIF